MKKALYLLPILLLILFSNFFIPKDAKSLSNNNLEPEKQWVDSIFQNLSLEEKIGQLMWVRAHSNLGADHIAKVKKLITNYHVGGLCFFQGTPEKQAQLTNEYQKLSKIPLILSMDAEWGLGMRLKETAISFPRQLMLGAIQDNRLIYDMGEEVAKQSLRLGVHVNFAPVADVNNNANNPVINTRSFGEDRMNVASKSYMYMKGMQDNGLIACAKHFPGHGDTDVDSHYDLPIINHDKNRLDSIELFPFRVLFDQKIGSVMVAHLQVNAIDSTRNLPTTLSRNAATDLLKKDLKYEGLVITDGLGMKGVTKHHAAGEVEAKALAAGNDILLLPQDVGAAVRMIKQYIANGQIDAGEFNQSVKKVLAYKYRLGLTKLQQVDLTNLRADLNNKKALALKRKLIQNAMTLVRNEGDILPIKKLHNARIASLAIGTKFKTKFQETIDLYKQIPHRQISKNIPSKDKSRLIKLFKDYETVIVSLHDLSSRASKNFGVSESTIRFLKELKAVTNVVLVVFGNPYSLKYFDNSDCILMAYEENDMSEDLAAQALFGAFSINGKLPVTASAKSKFGDGVNSWGLFRLGYGMPEEVGMNSDSLAKIAELTKKIRDSVAAPGGVVLVAKDNKIVYHEAFGFHQYSKSRPVKKDDIFDLASVTKIAATTISVMKLADEGKIDINNSIEKYLTHLDSTNKKGVKIEDMLSHHAQLAAWIPFFEETVTRYKKPMTKWYRKEKSKDFSIQITDNLWLKNEYADTIRNQIARSKMRPKRKYVYSDLGMILMGKTVEATSKQPLNNYVQDNFYNPLGLQTATYRPLEKHDKYRIPPTDADRYWRHERVQGHVHDMASAMMNGVAGHAGLFANANDLAIIMQMLLNGGYYGGEQFIENKTIQQFTTRCHDCTRRGLGFDMKELNPTKSENMDTQASDRTFGHLGFTGICAWADPDNNLIYIFLSNRTFPKWRGRNTLGKLNYRPRIQEVIYNALED